MPAKKQIDWNLFERLARFPLRQEDIAWILQVSVDTLSRGMKKRFKMTFAEYSDKNAAHLRYQLLEKQFQVAMKGSVPMLIWLGKQWLGQRDQSTIEATLSPGAPNQQKPIEEAKARVSALVDELSCFQPKPPLSLAPQPGLLSQS